MLETILNLISIACLGVMLFGAHRLLFKKEKRLRGLFVLGAGFVAFAAVGIGLAGLRTEAANEAGFDSYTEFRNARDAGISDPEEWAVERDRLALEAATLEAERLAREEQVRAAQEQVDEARRAQEERIEREEEEERRRQGFHCLSEWDGSHAAFKIEVREAMREPGSFEHISTRVTPIDEDGNHLIVMEYRARNGLGGMDVGNAMGFYRNDDCTHTLITVE